MQRWARSIKSSHNGLWHLVTSETRIGSVHTHCGRAMSWVTISDKTAGELNYIVGDSNEACMCCLDHARKLAS